MGTKTSPSMLVALAATLALAGVADGVVLRGTVGGGSLPAAGAGQTDIRAVNVQTSVIAGAVEVPRSGRWVLNVPAGPYSLLTSVTTRAGSRQAITPVVRVRRGAINRVVVSLRRTKAPRRATTKAVGHATVAGPVIAVRNLRATGPHPEFGRGFSNMFITDFLDGSKPCKPTVVEWEKRDLIQKEIDLGNSLNPGQRLQKRWINPQIFVEGSLTTTADGISGWEVKLRDVKTGDIVGGDHGTLAPGGDAFEAASQITDRLAEQLCGGTYTVAFNLTTDNLQAVYEAHGTITTTLTATGTGRAKGIPPTKFTGTVPIAYANTSFVAKISGCGFSGSSSDQGSLNVTLDVTPAGRLRVTWAPSPLTLAARSTIVCTQGSLPALGPGIAGVAPTSFELPVDGGSQTLSGEPALAVGGLGIFHNGTMIVTRNPAS